MVHAGASQDENGDSERFECISIVEYNEAAEKFGKEPGERTILSGVRREVNVPDEKQKGFVKIAEAVAIFELHKPLADDEITEWCNSPAGKLALKHWFDHYELHEVTLDV